MKQKNSSTRGLSLEGAAEYVGLNCTSSFEKLVKSGFYPAPLPYPTHGVRRKIWDIRALDKALDKILDNSDEDTSATGNEQVVSGKAASQNTTSLQESINARNAAIRNATP